jgi:hypothetical protein
MDSRPPGYTTKPVLGDLVAGVLVGPLVFLALLTVGAFRPGVGWMVLALMCAGATVVSWLLNQQRALAAEWRRAQAEDADAEK